MKIHKESYPLLKKFLIVFTLHLIMFTILQFGVKTYLLFIAAFAMLTAIVIRFFRVPKRDIFLEDNKVIAPADGKIVVIEEIEEKEYFHDKRIQVSIFMSFWDIHINWYPIKGTVVYRKYHPGKFLVARNPKSSLLNERTTVVMEDLNRNKILFRQIAGAVARRIVNYTRVGETIEDAKELGFIKFGSRVDILLPIGTSLNVELNQKTVGGQTVIATLNKE